MLRARKVLAYVAERLDSAEIPQDATKNQPDTWLELLCQDKVPYLYDGFTNLARSCKVDVTDYSDADVEAGRGYFIYLSVKVGQS